MSYEGAVCNMYSIPLTKESDVLWKNQIKTERTKETMYNTSTQDIEVCEATTNIEYFTAFLNHIAN